MNFDFVAVFILIAAFCGIIVSLILFFFAPHHTYNKWLLGISLFSCSWYCLMVAATRTHIILSFPHLFRTATPLVYLVAPASFLYIRSSIHAETRPKKYDWIHFVPFLFLCVELMPFYLKGPAYKIQVINYYLTDTDRLTQMREGFVNEHFHFIFRVALALLYCYLQHAQIVRFLSGASVKIKNKYRALINWFKLYILLITLTFSIVLLLNLLNLYFKSLKEISNVLFALHLLVISFILLFKPHILYSYVDEARINHRYRQTGNPAEKLSSIKCVINDLLQNQQKYLVKGYSLNNMAGETGIPAHQLSSTINREYQLSFTDLINKYRINHIIDNISQEKMANYTLETIGMDSGFSSRITFYRAFVKVTGQTPKAYFKLTKDTNS